MRTNKNIKVIHFNNGSGGGVLSVIKNLIEFSENPEIENHVIYTTEKRSSPTIIDFPKATSVRHFHYDRNWNFYHTCRQLSKLLPDDKAVIVGHDWLELGMASQLGLQNPVVQVLHGDYEYYYELAVSHSSIIDAFITVAENIKATLTRKLSERSNQIHYLRIPVPDAMKTKKCADEKHIIFIGRLTEGKGFHLLPEIARQVKEKGFNLQWHIVGEDSDGLRANLYWQDDILVQFYGVLPNEEVMELLSQMDFFILPSQYEGMPVTLIEAMKSGVIPLVNDIPGGIQELVIDGQTGFKIKENEVSDYGMRISEVQANKYLSAELSRNCVEKANMLFDPVENTKLIENIFCEASSSSKKKVPVRVYGSRLDKKWIPNGVVEWMRETMKFSKLMAVSRKSLEFG